MPAGRPLNIQDPQELLQLWQEYKQSVDDNPDLQQVATGKGVMTIKVKRPYLRAGFEAFVYNKNGYHIYQYFDNQNNAYEQFLGVVTHIRSEWSNDQLEGALTGRYKAPNLVARLNGLADKAQQEISGPNGGPIQITGMEIR